MQRFILPIEVERLPSGEYVACCPSIDDCHAEGRTADEAIERVEEIVRTLLDMKSPYAVLAHPHASPAKMQHLF